MHRENEDLDAWHTLSDLAGGLDAVDERQRVIDDGYVGVGGNGLGDGFFTVCRLSDNTPVALVFKDAPHTRAHHGVVISDQ